MELSALDRMTVFGDNEVCPDCEEIVAKTVFKDHVKIEHGRLNSKRTGFRKEKAITNTTLREAREEARQKAAQEMMAELKANLVKKQRKQYTFKNDPDTGIYAGTESAVLTYRQLMEAVDTITKR